MTCTRCDGTGFLNIHQIQDKMLNELDEIGAEDFNSKYFLFIDSDDNDVQICDCCGNGDEWYGIPGEHYTSEDPRGENGPYRYNGGSCECH